MIQEKTKNVDWEKIIEKTNKKSYNLYDLIPMKLDKLEQIDKGCVVETKYEHNNDFSDLKNKFQAIVEILNDMKEKYGVEDNANGFVEKILDTYNKKREDYFMANLDLPMEAIFKIDTKTHKEEEDLITYSIFSPKAKIANIKKIAEALGFLIMPYDIHNKKSYQNESPEIQKAIKKFEKLNKYCDLYVVSPLIYWDIKSHIEATDPNFEMYVSKKVKTIVNSVEIQLPVLREFNIKLKNHEERLSYIEQDMKNILNSINEIENKLEKIQNEISEVWKEMFKQKLEIEYAQIIANSAVKKAENAIEMSLKTIDPMLIAVKKGSKLSDDEKAIIGPIWGPDFSWIVPALENIQPQIGQREIVEELNPFLIIS